MALDDDGLSDFDLECASDEEEQGCQISQKGAEGGSDVFEKHDIGSSGEMIGVIIKDIPTILPVSRGIWRQVSYTTYLLLSDPSNPSPASPAPLHDQNGDDEHEEFYLEGSDDENGDAGEESEEDEDPETAKAVEEMRALLEA